MLHAWRSQKEKTLQVPLTGSVGLGWGQSPLPPHTHAQHWLLFLLYFCCYNFIKLLSGNNCSFNYSLLVINYLKINIMILFPFLLFFLFHYLSHLRCSLILGFFRDTPTAPAAQQSLSQCHLSLALPSISPSRPSGLRVHDAPAGERNIPQILHFSSLGADLVFVLLSSYIVTLHPGHRQQGSGWVHKIKV